jgi:hypothetical protein
MRQTTKRKGEMKKNVYKTHLFENNYVKRNGGGVDSSKVVGDSVAHGSMVGQFPAS